MPADIDSNNSKDGVEAGTDDVVDVSGGQDDIYAEEDRFTIDYESHVEFDIDILRKLKKNDPSITGLHINLGDTGRGYDALEIIDWQSDGYAISDNTHLKTLFIGTSAFDLGAIAESELSETNTEQTLANAKAFYKALSRNRHIKRLELDGAIGDIGDMFEILSPFFEFNTNFQMLDVFDLDLDARITKLLVTAISNCKTLKLLNFRANFDDEAEYDLAEKEIASLLGEHDNLRVLLCTLDLFRNNTMGWIAALRNRLQNPLSKLKELRLDWNTISDESAAVLGDGLSNNMILKKLSLRGMRGITSTGWADIFRGLSMNNSLLEIKLDQNKSFGDEGSLAFVDFMSNYSTLKSMTLSGVNIQSIDINKLRKSLLNLEEFSLYDSSIDDNLISTLGGIVSNSSVLKALNLGSNKSITSTGWSTFFGYLSSQSSLEFIDLNSNRIDDEASLSLASALSANTTLKRLELRNNTWISAEGWDDIFDALLLSDLSLEKLVICENNIDDEGVPSLTNALVNNSSLLDLDLSNMTDITSIGMKGLGLLLQDASCLEHLSFANSNNIDDEVMIHFAGLLIGNSSLKTLNMSNNFNEVTSSGWSALSNTLCNASNIDSIRSSNHSLHCIGGSIDTIDSGVVPLMKLNKDENKVEVVRQKIIKYYFLNGNKNIEEFVDRKLNILPHAMGWIGRNDTGHSLLYRLSLK